MNSPDLNGRRRARIAALEAAAALPGPDPVPSVSYRSAGKTLIVGSAADVAPWAEGLCAQLELMALLTDPPIASAPEPVRPYAVERGHKVRVDGWLGAFSVSWEQADTRREERFDLVLDLSAAPLLARHQPPPGYFSPGPSLEQRAEAVRELAQMIGEFEKPKYFSYKERLCAHSRNRLVGCNACIEICSAQAIEGAGDRIKVNPNLCAGCGACGTVCPTGAIAYAYPSAAYTGERLRVLVGAYRAEGGGAPVLLFHSGQQGRALIGALEDSAAGVPDHVIPVELEHTASVGIDVWLAAIAYGAGAVMVLMTDEEAPQYRAALAAQIGIAGTILNALGYEGEHCRLRLANTPAQLDELLAGPVLTTGVAEAGAFHLMADKRNSLDLALAHLVRHAPLKPDQAPLPAGSPFGAVLVDTGACSLCMACVGACPASALMDTPTAPELRFVEKNCVQCGLCVATCPENAIRLSPRMLFNDSWNKPVVLNQTQPFCCIRCGTPFGTLQMVENMLGKLAQHPAFAGKLDRIRMCGDCRVADIMKSGDSDTITGGKPPRQR